MWLKITRNYSPNFSLKKRSKQKIKFIILHYTGMRDETLAIKRLCNERSKVSAHYFIRKNGEILNLVPDLYEAWHAGKSQWKNFNSLNKYSIGIEIQNSGHNNNFENFQLKQLSSLSKLLKKLTIVYKINFKNILGHSDIAPERKKDPGEKFPWKKFYKKRLAFGHNLDEKKLRKLRLVQIDSKDKKEFLRKLYQLGYVRIKSLNEENSNKTLIESFQRRFRQNLVNGRIDKECLIIVKNLVKSN